MNQLEAKIPALLDSISLGGFIVRAFAQEDSLGRDDYISLDRDSLKWLREKKLEINDLIMLARMR